MPISQKYAARAKAVPVLWRDCAWPVPVFVHTRIGKARTGLAPSAGTFILAGRRGTNNRPAGVTVLRILSLNQPEVRARSNEFRHVRGITTFRRQQPRLVAAAENRIPNARRCSRIGAIRLPRLSRLWLQPRGCARAARNISENGTARRLEPVLAFAALQLGDLAPSSLRIYSVFEHPHKI
jgi:hypothetical protein